METPASWKVLMVLGNQTPFRRLMIAIRAEGHEIVSITDQFQGVTLVDDVQPDIILLDAEVPESWRTCSRIRDMVNIPIILIGLEAPQNAWERAVEEGADAYLSVFTGPGEAIATAGAILRRYRKTFR
ncbi:MAG: hypothetical protein QGG56_09425 [Dehalococcoidia bacterium]|jgi:DNA-binding response OmpR family regulator|nr:hypothetical protein [Dehalococcoidia bacterium]MDP6783768.1 hypothetical protein [Dehalococcoidia bacterium]